MHPDDETLTLLALGEQPEDGRAAAHLAGCPACRRKLDELSDIVSMARDAGPDAPPPPPARVWDRIAADIGGADLAPGPAPVPATPLRDHPARPRRRRALQVAAAVLALAGAATAGWLAGRPGTQQPGAVVRAGELRSLPDSPQQAATGTAEVLRTGSSTVLQVAAAGLPEPDGFYEVWMLDPSSGLMVALGALAPDQHGAFPVPPGLDPGRYSVVDISAQRYDGNPAHSALSVLRGTLTG